LFAETDRSSDQYNAGMASFADMSISAFLDALSAPEPTPGGGTAAAIAGAMGVSLLMMVAGLNKTRTNADEEKVALSETRGALASIRPRLTALADADSESFNQVIAAYRLPKETDAEKQVRKAAVRDGLRAATEAPLDLIRVGAEAVKLARTVAQHGSRAAASDVRVALELLEAAVAGAVANVETNLAGLDEEGYRKTTASQLFEYTNQVTEDAAAARTALM
jgi:formiminotetrahydrofolate cyclodeaminase